MMPPAAASPQVYLRSNLPVLPARASLTIELLCLLVLGVELALRATFLGCRAFLRIDYNLAKLVLMLASLADVLASVVAVAAHHGAPEQEAQATTALALNPVPGAFVGPPANGSALEVPIHTSRWAALRLSPLLRPLLFVVASVQLRALIRNLLLSIPRFIEYILMVALLILFYGILGVFLFRDFNSSAAEANMYFNSFSDAFVNMLILLTTANYPGEAPAGDVPPFPTPPRTQTS